MSPVVEINPGEILLSLRSENKMAYEPKAVRRRGSERDYSELDTHRRAGSASRFSTGTSHPSETLKETS